MVLTSPRHPHLFSLLLSMLYFFFCIGNVCLYAVCVFFCFFTCFLCTKKGLREEWAVLSFIPCPSAINSGLCNQYASSSRTSMWSLSNYNTLHFEFRSLQGWTLYFIFQEVIKIYIAKYNWVSQISYTLSLNFIWFISVILDCIW